MDQKFSRLRFKDFAKAAAAGAIVGAVALQPTDSLAATGSQQIITDGPGGLRAHWFVNTNITFSTTSSGSLAMSEASLHSTGTANNFNRNDAFDGVLSWHVYPNGSVPGGADFSGGYFKAGGAVSVTANSVVGPNKTLAGLTAHVELYFPSGSNVVRSVLFLQNPSGSPITVTVDNDSNLGSDANTLIRATSSGDAVFDSGDNWVVSCQASDRPGFCDQPGPLPNNDTSKDPIITYAFQGPGGIRATSAGAAFANGNDNPNFRWSGITVPAGETRALMMFIQLSDTDTNAEADAVKFNSNSTLQATNYLTGLSGAQQAEIVNWTLNSVAVPTLGEWALMALGGLLGLFGLERAGFFVRRRRRAA